MTFNEIFYCEEGQGMVEYGLIIALVATVCILALGGVGEKMGGIFNIDITGKTDPVFKH